MCRGGGGGGGGVCVLVVGGVCLLCARVCVEVCVC